MDYKDTLLMPQTDFQMRGNLPENEKYDLIMIALQKSYENGIYNPVLLNRYFSTKIYNIQPFCIFYAFIYLCLQDNPQARIKIRRRFRRWNLPNFRILPFFARGGTFVQHPCCKTAIYENLGNFGI